MSIREQVFTAFIKGIGRTSGTVTVFGLLGVAWFFYNKNTSSLTRTEQKETDVIVLQEVEHESEQEVELEVNDQMLNMITNFEKKNKNMDFRKIFDNI
jgi:hypothetical protein